MMRKLDIKDTTVVEQIIALQRESYRVEADIIGFDGIPVLRDTIETIVDCDETFYGYYIGTFLAGLISFKLDGETLDIHRVAVHPSQFRKGIAVKMLEFVEIVDDSVEEIVVSTGAKNQPAVNLYLKLGFEKLEEYEVAEGVLMFSFRKNLPRS